MDNKIKFNDNELESYTRTVSMLTAAYLNPDIDTDTHKKDAIGYFKRIGLPDSQIENIFKYIGF